MDRLATKTLAEIYLRQGYLQEAYEIYKTLAERDPSDSEIQRRIQELESKVHPFPPHPPAHPLSREEMIHYLTKWLANIRKLKKR